MKKRLYLCTRKNDEVVFKKPEKNILKNIWQSGKKVIPLHPQKEREVH